VVLFSGDAALIFYLFSRFDGVNLNAGDSGGQIFHLFFRYG
jgi:hypothetical protein